MSTLGISASFVVIHTTHSVTLVEYLFRVLLHLVIVAGIGVGTLWCVRAIGIVDARIGSRWRTNGDEP